MECSLLGSQWKEVNAECGMRKFCVSPMARFWRVPQDHRPCARNLKNIFGFQGIAKDPQMFNGFQGQARGDTKPSSAASPPQPWNPP
eukprot:7125343-Pyramimonas_sp.AAC.1